MKTVALLFLSVVCASAQVPIPTAGQFRDFIQPIEGYSSIPVHRANGEVVIGIGHNMAFDKVVKNHYSCWEIGQIYLSDYAKALKVARANVRYFDALPQKAQFVVLSTIWCCGPSGFVKFYDFRAYLGARLYCDAAHELECSLWARQDRARVAQHVEWLNSLE